MLITGIISKCKNIRKQNEKNYTITSKNFIYSKKNYLQLSNSGT